jgi:5-methylcytosine-specific restriction protein A
VVDHKRPHLGDLALLMSWDNLQAMSKACHDRKTAAVDGGFGNPVRW